MKWFSFLDDVVYLYRLARRKPAAPSHQEVFFLEPSYRAASVTGPLLVKRKTIVRVSGFAIILYLLLSLCILLAPISLAGQISADKELEQRGVTTRATVTACARTRSGRPAVKYTYSVTDSSGTVHQLTDESLGNYSQFCVNAGTVILIQYLAESPSTTRMIEPGLAAGGADLGVFVVTGFLAAVMLLIMAIAVWQYIRDSRRYRQLTSRGVLCSGYIVQAGLRTGYGGQELCVEYEFTAPHQRTMRGTQSRVRRDLDAGRLPVPGTPVRVIYVHDRLYWLL